MTNPLDHVDQLAVWLKDAGLARLELRGPTGSLRLLSDGASVLVVESGAPSVWVPTVTVGASSPGIFLDRHPLHERTIAPLGVDIGAGEPLGFLQVGPLLMAVQAPQAGTVIDVPVVHGTVVGYGAPLFVLQPMEGGTR